MEIRLAKSAGFCFGVERAVNLVYEQVETGKTIYTYGPITHNDGVVAELASKGVVVLEGEEELRRLKSGTVVIRAHGVPKRIYDLIKEQGLEVVDATCPFVKRIHTIVERESKAGKHIVVVGNAAHPEVEGIVGWCSGPVTVLEEPKEAEEFLFSLTNHQKNVPTRLCVVAQTTFNYKKFQYIVEIFGKKGYNDSVVNTICSATEERQTQARAIAREADVMLVIGGRHSSNTRKLYEICSKECAQTYFIQTLDDLHLDLPKAVRLVGITAGASTPKKLIEEVQNYVRINF